MTDTIPSYLDISPSNGLSLDEKSAAKHFLGKSEVSASVMIAENAMYYLEYFKYMGAKAFAYYLKSILLYLKSDKNDFDPDVLFSLIQTIQLRINHDKTSILMAAESINQLMSYLYENYDKFDIESDIHGDLRTEIKHIKFSLEFCMKVESK